MDSKEEVAEGLIKQLKETIAEAKALMSILFPYFKISNKMKTEEMWNQPICFLKMQHLLDTIMRQLCSNK